MRLLSILLSEFVVWYLYSTRLKDCDLGAIVNRDLTRRIRTVNGVTAHKQAAQNDLRLAARLVQFCDKKWSLWQESDERMDEDGWRKKDFGSSEYQMTSKNPLLKNITDYLIEEGSAEEDELLGLNSSNGGDEQKVVLDRNEELLKVLDRLLIYLRLVHSVDYYNHGEYPSEEEMPNRCGLMHVRGPPPSSTTWGQDEASGQPLISVQFLNEFTKGFEQKMQPLLTQKDRLGEGEVEKLGKKDPEKEVEAFITSNCVELAKDKWLCPLSGKKFKGPEFIRKHVANKHGEKLDEVRLEVTYFNNYLSDSKRPTDADLPKPASGYICGGICDGNVSGGDEYDRGIGMNRLQDFGDGNRYGGGYHRGGYGGGDYGGAGGYGGSSADRSNYISYTADWVASSYVFLGTQDSRSYLMRLVFIIVIRQAYYVNGIPSAYSNQSSWNETAVGADTFNDGDSVTNADDSESKLSPGAITGIVFGVFFAICFIVVIVVLSSLAIKKRQQRLEAAAAAAAVPAAAANQPPAVIPTGPPAAAVAVEHQPPPPPPTNEANEAQQKLLMEQQQQIAALQLIHLRQKSSIGDSTKLKLGNNDGGEGSSGHGHIPIQILFETTPAIADIRPPVRKSSLAAVVNRSIDWEIEQLQALLKKNHPSGSYTWSRRFVESEDPNYCRILVDPDGTIFKKEEERIRFDSRVNGPLKQENLVGLGRLIDGVEEYLNQVEKK